MRKTAEMLTFALIAFFVAAMIAALGTLADSSLRGLRAWQHLLAQLEVLDTETEQVRETSNCGLLRLRPALASRAGGSHRLVPAAPPVLRAAA